MQYTQIKELISNPTNSVLTLHLSPDPDSIGSNLALYHLLQQYGHTCTIYSQDPVPEELGFLSGFEDIHIKQFNEVDWESFEVFWALDLASPARIRMETFPESLKIVNIDHHDTNNDWGHINFVEPEAAATAFVLHKIFQEADIPINTDIATCLLTGLAGDTGFFNYAVTPEVLKTAADFIKSGANYNSITFNVLNQMSFKDLQFVGLVLQRAELYPEKRCIVLAIPHELWISEGESMSKNKYIVQYLSSIKDTDFGALIIEEEPDLLRFELRSHAPGFNVAEIATRLGGGGHIRAAGARIKDTSLEEGIKLLFV